jgi:hypothetical protein
LAELRAYLQVVLLLQAVHLTRRGLRLAELLLLLLLQPLPLLIVLSQHIKPVLLPHPLLLLLLLLMHSEFNVAPPCPVVL